MNDQLIKLMDKANFLIEKQLPDALTEYLQCQYDMNMVSMLCCLIAALISFYGTYKLYKVFDDEPFLAIMGFLLGICFALIVLLNMCDMYKISKYPKAYLLEKLIEKGN